MIEQALVAAGCFWKPNYIFSKIPGILNVKVGYTGGHVKNPTYEAVCQGNTGHAEACLIEFDSSKINYTQILEVFWECHDPTTLNRQGPDLGTQYRSAIFYFNLLQKKLAEDSKNRWQISGYVKGDIVTEIAQASEFYPAEEYHQCYIAKKELK